ncbi:MAG: N-formylglutamate amidohydrolase [Rhizobiales bacterium]|nr:N-formylglutamate amidohydrolase [Hyphomicrobiales bacterium]
MCVLNAAGRGRFVVLVDHASHHVPGEYAMLGLTPADLVRHIAWDPGALPVASLVAGALDAPLIHAAQSRLVIDVNRSPDAGDLIAAASEDTDIPGNQSVSGEERRHRMERFYAPYHQAIDEVLARREREGLATALISIHTFTPVFRGVPRPWHIGILHDGDTRLARPLMAALTEDREIVVGDNQPYSPADGVYYTLAHHGDERGLATAMIEIRNDLVADEDGQQGWAERLAKVLGALDLPARAA